MMSYIGSLLIGNVEEERFRVEVSFDATELWSIILQLRMYLTGKHVVLVPG